MKVNLYFFLIVTTFSVNCQNINVNNDFNNSLFRYLKLKGSLDNEKSLNIRPINSEDYEDIIDFQNKTIYKNNNNSVIIKSLGIDYHIEYNTKHPYNKNNGTMIPNRGYQHIISPGLFLKTGPLTIQFKPEHHFSENQVFDGFWEGHYPEIWAERYRLWNHIDMPERFGNNRHNKFTLGQSSIRLNWKGISLGISNENLWWGPSIRNSIMLSNNAEGFRHITFNSNRPLKTFFGNIEWQFITGRLESSGFTPPRTDYEHAGRKLYVRKINQMGRDDDWRFLQGYIISYAPKYIQGLSFGLIRWVQMYSDLIDGKYWWMEHNKTYFPIFQNFLRKNDKYIGYEQQTNQAAGVFFNWLWKDSNAEIYFEFHMNDSKINLRDLILDSDHSRASTIGLQKIFNINNKDYIFNWEWTQMEQTAGRLIRNAQSWYEHAWVYDGYTNKGEVLGSSIGPGSNSHYISFNAIEKTKKIGLGIEIIDHDNDFYHVAFASARDFRRYWKDFNLHFNYYKRFNNFSISSNLIYIRSLNYQWELDDFAEPYYHPGRDVNNFHLTFKMTYFGNW